MFRRVLPLQLQSCADCALSLVGQSISQGLGTTAFTQTPSRVKPYTISSTHSEARVSFRKASVTSTIAESAQHGHGT